MKTIFIFTILISISALHQSCRSSDQSDFETPLKLTTKDSVKKYYTIEAYNNTKGILSTGEVITHFYCPDAINEFPPIDIKSWNKVPAVNNRFPTYEETLNGTAIHHYGEKPSKLVKAYSLSLPKLARYIGPVSTTIASPKKDELVVVIQIVQTPADTIVGYRFLSGGVGGSKIRDYHFLTEHEIDLVTNP